MIFELPRKMGPVAKTGFDGDLRDALMRVLEQPARIAQPQLTVNDGRPRAYACPKQPFKLAA